MPDWHPGVWQTNQELLNSGSWIKNWVGLVNDMINLPNTAGKLILDLLNVRLGMHEQVLCVQAQVLCVCHKSLTARQSSRSYQLMTQLNA